MKNVGNLNRSVGWKFLNKLALFFGDKAELDNLKDHIVLIYYFNSKIFK